MAGLCSRMPGVARRSILFLLLLSCVGVRAVVTQFTPEPQPTCYSTSKNYFENEFIVPVQPAEPTLIRRYQAPELRLFCISFNETGPACGTDSIPRLCYRIAAAESSPFTCEELTPFVSEINSRITKGSINGPDIIWLIQWDGTGKAPECYPRAVEARVFALLRNDDVANTTLFVLALILAIGALLLGVVGFIYFFRQRLAQIDEAGAVTMGGPKLQFAGPQIPVREPEAEEIFEDLTKVYLPITMREGAATKSMTANEFGEFARRVSTMPPAAPAPGDGLSPSKRRRRKQRSSAFELGDGEEFEDHFRGRRRGRRGEDGYVSEDQMNRLRASGTFPTASTVTNVVGPDGTVGTDSSVTSRTLVKYVPQWMKGNFGKGGLIPEVGTEYEEERQEFKRQAGYQSGGEQEIDRTRGAAGQFYRKVTPRRTGENDENVPPFESPMQTGSGMRRRKTRGGYHSEEESQSHDSFQRGKAKFGGGQMRQMEMEEREAETVTAKPPGGPPPRFKCAKCGVFITGAPSDPKFCVVSGEMHY